MGGPLEVATVVDVDALLKVVGSSLLGAVAVTAAFSAAIHGIIRLSDARQSGRGVEAGAFAALAAVALLVFAGAVVLGLLVMTSK